MTSTDVRERARQAHRFPEAATDSVALHPDHANVAVSNAVLAGIAAGDAIVWAGRLTARMDALIRHR